MTKEPEFTLESPAADTSLAVREPSPITILEKAISGGVTQENVAVVKELVQMCREQRAEDAKAAFAKAYFQLRKNMPEMYADKEARNDSGKVVYCYCSEEEITKKLEPHLLAHGLAMLFGQSERDGRITVNITLLHELGHSEVREFTVRAGLPNKMKDAAMCDTGGATTAWRHLVMSRISDQGDAHVEGEAITDDKLQYLKEQMAEAGFKEAVLLDLAGVDALEKVTTGKYQVLLNAINMKRRKAT
jgi:hypothetical protein